MVYYNLIIFYHILIKLLKIIKISLLLTEWVRNAFTIFDNAICHNSSK